MDDVDGGFQLVIEQLQGEWSGIAVITLNRPEQRNPLDWETVRELRDSLRQLASAGRTRVVIVTGAGRAFSAGGDLKRYQSLYRRPSDFEDFLTDVASAFELLERGPFASIAMVNGPCVAGGLEMALSCDFIIAGETARIGDGHLAFGQLPGGGGSQRLVHAIGTQQAKYLVLTGELLPAAEAAEIGLVARVFPDDTLRQRTLEVARSIAGHSPLGVRLAKELLHTSHETFLGAGLAEERRVVAEYATTSQDATEGLLAFAERRSAVFVGQ